MDRLLNLDETAISNEVLDKCLLRIRRMTRGYGNR